jgi:hypothetical protein
MRAFVLALAVGVCVVGCSSHKGSSSSTDDPNAPGDPNAPPAPNSVAQNISLDEVAFFQSIKVSVAKGDSVPDRGSPAVPILGGRDATVRVYVTPGDGWSPHQVTARLKITTHTPTGTLSQVFSTTKSVESASTDDSLDSTINIDVPGDALRAGATFAIVLNEDKGAAAQSSDNARFPRDGSFADLGVSQSGSKVRVMIVPVQYNADGSGRLPDTSDDQLAKYKNRFFQLYPAATIEITVRDPYPWGSIISASGAGYPQILMAMPGLHASDGADPDLYYYAAFEPANSFGQFCGGGCIAGLSAVGMPHSVGLGYNVIGGGGGNIAAETSAHEVGHAHGLKHAPCGGAANPDPAFPYANGGTGVWGLDPIDHKTLYPPSQDKDVMGYCPPTWISDYHFTKIFSRVQTDNQLLADRIAGVPARSYRAVQVGGDGTTTWTEGGHTRWPENGEPHTATFEGAKGNAVASDRAFWFPFDHLPGGVLLVPERTESFARVRVQDIGVIAR